MYIINLMCESIKEAAHAQKKHCVSVDAARNVVRESGEPYSVFSDSFPWERVSEMLESALMDVDPKDLPKSGDYTIAFAAPACGVEVGFHKTLDRACEYIFAAFHFSYAETRIANDILYAYSVKLKSCYPLSLRSFEHRAADLDLFVELDD